MFCYIIPPFPLSVQYPSLCLGEIRFETFHKYLSNKHDTEVFKDENKYKENKNMYVI